MKTEGSTRTPAWLSNDSRSGPGRMVTVPPVGVGVFLKIIDNCWRSLVGSPWTSMNWAVCVTGSNTMMKSCGSCSDIVAFSPAGSSSASSVTSSVNEAKDSLSRSTPELQNTCLKYSHKGNEFGSCAAMCLIRGLTVKATSTCSSTEAS